MAFNIEIANRASSAGIGGLAEFGARNAGARLGYNGISVYQSGEVKKENAEQSRQDITPDVYQEIQADSLEMADGTYSYTFGHYPTYVKFGFVKNLVITEINDGDGEGEVIEDMGDKPSAITITGILVDEENHHMPYDQVKALKELFDRRALLEVSSDLFNELGIFTIVLTSLNIDPVAEYPDTVKYEFSAKSVKAIELNV